MELQVIEVGMQIIAVNGNNVTDQSQISILGDGGTINISKLFILYQRLLTAAYTLLSFKMGQTKCLKWQFKVLADL